MSHNSGRDNVLSDHRCRILFGLAAIVVLVVVPGAASLAQESDPLSIVAAENAQVSARIVDTAVALDHARADLARLHKATQDIDESTKRIDDYARLPGLGREFVQTVIEQLRMLPRPEALTVRVEQGWLVVATSDEHLRAQRALRDLGDVDAAVAQRLKASGRAVLQSHTPDIGRALRHLLAKQRDLLTDLVAQQQLLLKSLSEIADAEQGLEQRSEATRGELLRLLFWIPVRPGKETFTELAQSLAWTVSPANWRAAGTIVRDEMARRPRWPSVALLVAVGLFAMRKPFRSKLTALAPPEMPSERYRMGHALAAIAITVALALPIPIVMETAAMLLRSAPDTLAFPRALGEALKRVGVLVLALTALAWMLDPRGVGVRHFGWDEALLTSAARAVRRLAAPFVPLMFVAALNGVDDAPFTNRESLTRLTIILAIIISAAFFANLLRRNGLVMQRFSAHAPRSWVVRLHTIWFIATLALHLGIIALSLAGYFVAAAYFLGHMVRSLFLLLGALMLYGLTALWVQLKRSQLTRHRQDQAEKRAEVAPAGESGGVSLPVERPIADIAAIGEQTRALVDLMITLLLLWGMWWVWNDVLPALSEIGDYALWTYTETVDGKKLTRPLTVGHLFLAMLVGAVTAVAVRNVGAVLDIVLLQRLEAQADATYAIKVTARYALAAVGIVLAANILGIAWGDVQWLLAALGVGLGFGLQEIFGNFVAGLILLVERPVRIGDVVTIGDVSGTVKRVRMRVVTVIDFDNKEVLIPNKSLITDRVINWTLSSQTTRLLLTVSVSSESDVALVQRVMLEAVQRNPDLLQDPPPRVFLVGFRAGALTFEINAFVDSFAKRQRVQHEINVSVDQALRENGIKLS